MSSSSLMTLRTLFMLSCLILIPLAAIPNSPLPRWVELAEGSLRAALAGPSRAEATEPATAQRPGEASFRPNARGLPPEESQRTGEAARPPGAIETAKRLPRRNSQRPAAITETSSAQADPPPPGAVEMRSVARLHAGEDPEHDEHVAPASFPGEFDERELAPVAERLRELGATHYRLETWGSGERMYRFTCKIALDPQGRAARFLEATSAEPVTAARQVLAEAESWRSAGVEGAMRR